MELNDSCDDMEDDNEDDTPQVINEVLGPQSASTPHQRFGRSPTDLKFNFTSEVNTSKLTLETELKSLLKISIRDDTERYMMQNNIMISALINFIDSTTTALNSAQDAANTLHNSNNDITNNQRKTKEATSLLKTNYGLMKKYQDTSAEHGSRKEAKNLLTEAATKTLIMGTLLNERSADRADIISNAKKALITHTPTETKNKVNRIIQQSKDFYPLGKSTTDGRHGHGHHIPIVIKHSSPESRVEAEKSLRTIQGVQIIFQWPNQIKDSIDAIKKKSNEDFCGNQIRIRPDLKTGNINICTRKDPNDSFTLKRVYQCPVLDADRTSLKLDTLPKTIEKGPIYNTNFTPAQLRTIADY